MNLRKQLSSYIALNNYVEAIRSSQLPTGYTELEYIESTGTQYIDTGIVNWNNTLEYEIKLSIEPQSGIKTYFGCYDEWNTSKNNVPNISTWTNYRVASNFRAGYSSNSGANIGISNGQTGTISLKGNTISWSEGSSTSFDRGYDFTVSSSIFLFAQHANTGATEFAKTKIYRAKFWLNGELIRDFRPMLDYNNVACMFDMVTGKCFYNQGTDAFITGPEVYKSSIVLTDAITNGLTDLQLKGSEVKNKPETFLDSVVAKGGTEQNGTPTPDTPMDIVSNNGVLKVSPNLFDKNASYALFNGYINNVSVGENTTLMPCSGGDKTIIIKVAPNTTYTVTRVTDLGSVYDRIRCAAFTALPVSNSTGVILCNYMNTQQANATFTTLSDTQYVAINVRNSGAVGDDWTQFVDAFQLEQGSTATQYRPYGQIYADGTPETVTITGKNLYDVTKDTTGKYIGKDGSIGNDSYSCYSGLIPVKEGESYTYSGVCNIGAATANNKRIHGYVNGIWNQQITVIAINENTPFYTTFTIPSGINGIRISHWYKDENTQVEEGIRPTKYEEYYQASFTPEDLLKLSDYQDVQNVLDGVVTRNVGVKVLDGTESWTRYGTGQFAMPLIGSKKQDRQEAPFATHFVGTSRDNVPVKDGYVSVFNGSIAPTSGTLGINYQATPELTQFKQWLADQYAAGTPVIVVYPLANTVEETVESRDVFITSGTNTIERNSEYVASDGMTVKYKKLR